MADKNKQPIINPGLVTGPTPIQTRPENKKPIVNNSIGYKKPIK